MRVRLSESIPFLLGILLWIAVGMVAPGASAADAESLPLWSVAAQDALGAPVVSTAQVASLEDRVAIVEDERDLDEEWDDEADPAPVGPGPRGPLRWERPPSTDTTREAETPATVLIARVFQLSLAARGPPRLS